MTSTQPAKAFLGSQALRTLAALVIVVAGLKLSSSFLVPLLLAGFFALALNPVTAKLRDKGVPTWLAILISFLLAVGLVFAIGMLIASSQEEMAAALPGYAERISALVDSATAWLAERGVPLTPDGLDGLGVQPEKLLGYAGGLVSSLGTALSNAVVVLMVMVFMMFEVASSPARSKSKDLSKVDRGAKIAQGVTDYLSIKTVISLLTGLAWGVFLAIVGVDFPVVWGLLAFILNYVPNVGSFIAAIPPILLALVQFGPGTALLCIGGTLAINGIFGNVLEPKLMGAKVGLSVLVVFVGLIFWSWVFGAVGALLSVPLTMSLKTALEATDDYERIARMLGPPAKGESEPAT